MDSFIKCPTCDGFGLVININGKNVPHTTSITPWPSGVKKCPECKGLGEIRA